MNKVDQVHNQPTHAVVQVSVKQGKETAYQEQYFKNNLIRDLNDHVVGLPHLQIALKCGLDSVDLAKIAARNPGNEVEEMLKKMYELNGVSSLRKFFALIKENGYTVAVDYIVASPCMSMFVEEQPHTLPRAVEIPQASVVVPHHRENIPHVSLREQEKCFQMELVWALSDLLCNDEKLFMSSIRATQMRESAITNVTSEYPGDKLARLLLAVKNCKGIPGLQKFFASFSMQDDPKITKAIQLIIDSKCAPMFIEGTHYQEQPRQAQTQAQPSPLPVHQLPPSNVQVHQPAKEVKDEDTCVVCMDKKKTHIFNNCMHLCVCGACAPMLKSCPVCRKAGPVSKVFF